MAEEKKEEAKMKYMVIAVDERVDKEAAAVLKDCEVFRVKTMGDFEKFLETPPEGVYPIILCGPEIEGLEANELAQSLRMNYQNSMIFYTTTVREGFERKLFQKNGFTDAFLFPFDQSYMRTTLEEVWAQAKGIKVYRAVKLMDIQPGQTLDFDVSIYMPRNNRYVKINNAGDSLDKDRADRLKAHQVNSVHVAAEDMPKFFDYSANALIEMGKADNNTMTETERQQKLQGAVRDLVINIFNSDAKSATVNEGKQILEDTQKIVQQYILQSKPDDWYQKLLDSMGEMTDSYSHASTVSTYAALFAIGMDNVVKPEDVAVAGLFHDLGEIDVGQEILDKTESERTPEEKAKFEKHPEYSLEITKRRKLIIPENVMKAISQHHERFDRKGYPNQPHESKICKEAQILQIADKMDYLTRIKPGETRLTPAQAIRDKSLHLAIEPQLMNKIFALFPKDDAAASPPQEKSGELVDQAVAENAESDQKKPAA